VAGGVALLGWPAWLAGAAAVAFLAAQLGLYWRLLRR
jgi:hypothetical protein